MAMPIKAICKWMLLGVLASMSLQSCVYDKSEDCPATPDDNDGKTYMSIRFEFKQLRQSGVETRTFQPSYEDEDYERKVSDFRIFLVNKEDPDAEVIEIKDVPMVDEVTTEPFEIDRQYMHGYLLYVVANAAGSGFSPDLSSGKAFRGSYSPGSIAACSQIWSKNKFLMVNVNNEAADRDTYIAMREGDTNLTNPLPVADDPTPNGGVQIEIDEGREYPYSNPYRASVTLERLAAKIIVDCSEENFDFQGNKYYNDFHDVRVTGVALVNAANCFNLVQQWKVACYQGPKYFNYEWEQRRKGTWNHDAIPENSPYGYPYLWAVSPASDIMTTPSEIYYNQISDFTDFDNQKLCDGAKDLFISVDDVTVPVTMYCLENTSPLYLDFMSNFQKGVDNIQDKTLWEESLEDGMHNRVTGVLFRVRAKIKDDSHNNGDLIQDPDKGVWTKGSTEDDYKTFYGYQDVVYTRLEELLDEMTALKSKISPSSSVKELRDAGVKVYEDGYMYYVHWIVDQNYEYMWNYPNEADEGDAFNYKAVLRNTRYVVKVKSVNEIGMDLPGREIQYTTYKGTKILQGMDYLLTPTNTSRLGFTIDDYLPYLKNKVI
jgi:hypothetical protein